MSVRLMGRTGRLRDRCAALLGAAALLSGCVPALNTLASGATPAKAGPKPATAPSTTAYALSGWLHTSGSRIIDAGNHTVTIRAVNWFGLETANCAPHGLWTISLGTALDQLRSFGFNTIRLPYANQCLDAGATTSGIDFHQNPELQGKTPLQLMDTVVAEAGKRGLKIILDQHRPDTGAQSELWYTSQYSEVRWISDWRMLAARYRTNPTVIGADLHNEPHGSACWGCADPSRDWAAAATRAGNAVLAANPNLLVLVEGVERQADGTNTWWGGGLADARSKPIRLTATGHLVYSPHDYPASIYQQTWFNASNYPANLPGVWDRNWGYLATTGRAPVLLGEFGTRLLTASDKQWLTALVGYLGRTGISFAYWSYNPNSGDTGGLVADDWRTPQTAKLTALQPILGAAVPVPEPTTTPAPAPIPSQPVPTGPATATWHLQSSGQSGPPSNYGYVAQLVVSARDPHAGWTVSWPDPGASSVASSWGMSCSVAKARVTCSGTDWARALLPGQPLNVGLQVISASPGPALPSLTVSVTG